MRVQIEERIVRIVYKGESFGDLSDFAKRGTNAIAKEVSHLLIIRKQYMDFISKVQVKSDIKLKY
jgi:CRP-like cAMP-binding protein